MNKKILAIVLTASIAVTGLFAYSGKSVVLEANQDSKSYSFIIQYNGAGNGNSETLYSLDLLTGGTTEAFTLETKDNGNMETDIKFTTEIVTGEFVNQLDEEIGTGWYPRIIDDKDNITAVDHPTTVTSTSTSANSNADLNASTSATYTTTFVKGKHDIGTEIARFKLQYQGDDEVIAGKYRSTSVITITSDES